MSLHLQPDFIICVADPELQHHTQQGLEGYHAAIALQQRGRLGPDVPFEQASAAVEPELALNLVANTKAMPSPVPSPAAADAKAHTLALPAKAPSRCKRKALHEICSPRRLRSRTTRSSCATVEPTQTWQEAASDAETCGKACLHSAENVRNRAPVAESADPMPPTRVPVQTSLAVQPHNAKAPVRPGSTGAKCGRRSTRPEQAALCTGLPLADVDAYAEMTWEPGVHLCPWSVQFSSSCCTTVNHGVYNIM